MDRFMTRGQFYIWQYKPKVNRRNIIRTKRCFEKQLFRSSEGGVSPESLEMETRTSKYRRTLFLQSVERLLCSVRKSASRPVHLTSSYPLRNSLPVVRCFKRPTASNDLLRNVISVIVVCILASAKSCRSHIKGSYRSVPSRQSEGDGSGGRLM